MKKEFAQKKFTKRRLGFSFLEISIVITIVGLIMFGIFQGGALINKAKVSAAAQMTQSSIVGKMEGLTLWLETTKLSESFGNANLENGDTVTNWYDLSSKDHDFTGTATYLNNSINGLPAISFDGTNVDLFSRSNVLISDFVMANQGTVFLVQNYVSGTNNSIFWETTGQVRLGTHSIHSNGTLYFDFGDCCTSDARTTYVPSSFIENNNIITLVKYPSSASIIINGSIATTNSIATGSLPLAANTSTFYVGGGSFFNGRLAELIIFERALSDNEINDVEKYLSKKWGIAIEE